jgi:uncharacterized membrane protein
MNSMSARPVGVEDDETPAEAGLGRLLAFSDGVFAIAITLLVLNLNVEGGLTLGRALHGFGPKLFAAALSFAVIGRYWLAHHRTFSSIRRLDGRLLVLNLIFLAAIVVMPFTTQLLADYGNEPVSVMAYAGSIGAAGALLTLLLAYAVAGRRLVASTLSTDVIAKRLVGSGFAATIFFGSIPVALASPTVAELCWILVLWPASWLVVLARDPVSRLVDRRTTPVAAR